MNSSSNTIPNSGRYQIHESIGGGAMGVVYRATDRLSGQYVALKQVHIAVEALHFASRPPDGSHESLQLALAHEFRTLASLRHPHIISVLDYGFDAGRQPFFTMELLAPAQPILDLGRGLPRSAQVALLAQVAEALAYLHQSGILHHDLKPANILVADGRVRLLDFGLSVAASHVRHDDAFGTLLYLPPEVLDGFPYTAAADLYGLGVIAYELLVGRHPFPATTMAAFVEQLFTELPDLAPLADQPALANLVGSLLAKDPADRPDSAHAVLAALTQAVGQAGEGDKIAIRESYLQAAAFVGREHELALLRAALAQTVAGLGGLWLIGGESGVGKSRLLKELRAEALVAGALVAAGQAAEDGGLPYQLWRGALPYLLVEGQIGAAEASALKGIVPSIERLLGRPVPDAPEVAADTARERLALALIALFRCQTRPVVLLLEDLQWAGESLHFLRLLSLVAGELPLLILATYRDDELRDLPKLLPEMRLLPLRRLSAPEIAALSRGMLGDAGNNESLVRLLQRETEGNAFFLVEVVRALAWAAGDIALVGHATLPTQVLAGGVRQVVRRRLGRVPPWAWELLIRAAVAGRTLDLMVMAQLARRVDLADWVAACAEAAVLSPEGDVWQFAHDKLREAILADLTDAERPNIHRAVAVAIEAVHGGDPDYTEALAEHWYQAGEAKRMLQACRLVAEHILRGVMQFDRALPLLERALRLPDVTAPQRPYLLVALGDGAERRSRYDQAAAYYQACLDLGDTAPPTVRVRALNGLSTVSWYHKDFSAAENAAQQAIAIARTTDAQGVADSLSNLGLIAANQGDHGRAEMYYQEGLQISQAIGAQSRVATFLNRLGSLAALEGDYARANAYLQEGLQIGRSIGDLHRSSGCLNNLGNVALNQHDYARARAVFQESLEISRAIDDRFKAAGILANLARLTAREGQHAEAQHLYQESLAALRHAKAGDFIAETQAYLAWSLIALGEPDAAWNVLREALASIGQRDGGTRYLLVSLTVVVRLRLFTGDAAGAALIAGLVDAHPETDDETRSAYLAPMFADMEVALGAATLAAAREQGRTLTLDTLVAEVLAVGR